MISGIEIAAGAIVATIIVPAISRQVSDEFKAWTPRLTSRLLERAIRQVPESQRERYRDAWADHLEHTPGEVGKWVEACSCLVSAWRIHSTERRPRIIRIGKTTILLRGDSHIVVYANVVGMSASLYAQGLVHAPHHCPADHLSQRIPTPIKARLAYMVIRSIASVFR